ncbi:FAD-binding oxidoreductase [Candidatus Gracilibacteria bacterium]|nr:FAD-binding oxidoreductase [Candidatus Gracilibacteria bacterium]
MKILGNNSFFTNAFKNFNKEKQIYSGIGNNIPNSSLPKEVETLIIGGGLLGLSTAIRLAKDNRDVVVVDMNKIGEGASGRSGGQLWPGYEMSFSEMEEKFGSNLTVKTWNLTDETLLEIHERINTREDKCDFVPGLLLASKTKNQTKFIKEEARIMKEKGMDFVTFIPKEEMNNYVNTNVYSNGILFKGNIEGRQYGHINPLKYVQTTALVASGLGVKLVENTKVEGVYKMKNSKYRIVTSKGEIIVKNVIFATGADFIRPKGVDYNIIPRTHIPVQTIIIATEPIAESIVDKIIPSRVCFCDAGSVAMNYVALIPDKDKEKYYRLTFGGADTLMQLETALEIPRLEKEMREMFPQLDEHKVKIDKTWGGDCDMSRTTTPIIANPQDGIYYAAGFSGQGMVNTALYGTAIAERIIGENCEKFEILEKINSHKYSNNSLIAWLQASEMVFLKGVNE